MIEDWNIIEADFQREYDIHLLHSIENGMTWRRFNALLGNLGPYSVLANMEEEDVIEDEDRAESFLESW